MVRTAPEEVPVIVGSADILPKIPLPHTLSIRPQVVSSARQGESYVACFLPHQRWAHIHSGALAED
jgi:hypothetical protein